MKTLKELRAKFPQYNDMDDQQFSDAFHKKYYSDIPKNEFYEKIGFSQKSKPTGIKAIAKDVYKTIENLPETAVNFAESLPGELQGAISHPIRSLENVAAGLGEGVIGAFNAPHNLSEYLGKKDIFPFNKISSYVPHVGNLGIEEKLGLEEQQPGDALIRGLSSFAVPGKLAKFNEAPLAKRLATTAGYSIGQNENPLESILLGEGLSKAVGGAEKLYNKARPSSFLGKNLTKQELKNALEENKGLQTNLGDVLKSPTIKRFYENVLPHVLGSNTSNVMIQNAKAIQNKGNNIVKSFTGNFSNKAWQDILMHSLKSAASEAESKKKSLFENVNDLAERHGIKTGRSNFINESKNILKSINRDKHLKQFTPKETISLLENISLDKKSIKNIDENNATKKDVMHILNKLKSKKKYTLKDSDVLRGKLGDMAHEANIKGEKNKASIYSKLKKSLEEDINNAIDTSNIPEIKNARDKAMGYYRDQYSIYKDKDIRKFVDQGGDPDLILQHFIKTGKNDRANILLKLRKAADTQTNGKANILAGTYLSQAMDEAGNINPVKLSSLYHKLGTKQKVALFGNNPYHRELKKYINAVDKNKESFNQMFNPPTGQRNLDLLAKISQLGGAVAHGNGLVGAALPLLGAGLGARFLTKKLSSPDYREKLINSILNYKPKELKKLKQTARVLGVSSKQKPLELEVTEYNRE